MTGVVPGNESGAFSFFFNLRLLFASLLRLHQICEGHRLLTLSGQKGSELQAACASNFQFPDAHFLEKTIQSSCMLKKKTD